MSDDNGFAAWGGYMQAKVAKLEDQFKSVSERNCKSQLFRGVSIYVNGLTDPPAFELKRLMMLYGGVYHHYKRAHTSYTIASNLPDVKLRQQDGGKERYIKPQWILDCIKAGRILSCDPYYLVTQKKNSQPALSFKPATLVGPESVTAAESVPQMDDAANTDAANEVTHEQIRLLLQTARQLAIGQDDNDDNDAAVELNGIEQDWEMDWADTQEAAPLECTVSPTEAELLEIANELGGMDGGRRKTTLTAADPGFLDEYYRNSRLHQISQLKNQFIGLIRKKREQNSFKLDELLALKKQYQEQGIVFNSSPHSKLVMHIDMDCFFVSVGLLKHPELRGKPVVVTHSKGGATALNVPTHALANRAAEQELFVRDFESRDNALLASKVKGGFESRLSLAEIASCSYEARQRGIRNGMFVGEALQLCPELKTMPYDFEEYKRIGTIMYETLCQYTLDIEAVSCDEMYVNLDGILRVLRVSPMVFVRSVRAEIARKTGCPCSAGVGANKLQARVATLSAKPNNQFHLQDSQVAAHMAQLGVGDLPGVGQSAENTLKKHSIFTCDDLQKMPLECLQKLLGPKPGNKLHLNSKGEDDRQLDYVQERKSISMEVNYGIRFQTNEQVRTFLLQLCTEAHKILLDENKQFGTVVVKVMRRADGAPIETSKYLGHGPCDTMQKSKTLSQPSTDLSTIKMHALQLYDAFEMTASDLRGIAVQLKKLVRAEKVARQGNVLLHMFDRMRQTKNTAAVEPKASATKRFGADDHAAVDTPLHKLRKKPHTQTTNAAELQHNAPPVAAVRQSSLVVQSEIESLLRELNLLEIQDWSREMQHLAVSGLIDHEMCKPPVYDDAMPSTSRDVSKTIIPNARVEPLRKLLRALEQDYVAPGDVECAPMPATNPEAQPMHIVEIHDSLESAPPVEQEAPSYNVDPEANPNTVDTEGNFLFQDGYKTILSQYVMFSETVFPVDEDQLTENVLHLIYNWKLERLYELLKHLHGLIVARTAMGEEKKAKKYNGKPPLEDDSATEMWDAVTCRWHTFYLNLKLTVESAIACTQVGWQLLLNFKPIQCTRCICNLECIAE